MKTGQCKKICYGWNEWKAGTIKEVGGCKYFSIKRSKAKCKLFGKLKSQVIGEVFYLGRVIK